MNKEIIDFLISAFPNSFINSRNEFIAHEYSNQYIILENCESELDLSCKILEWFSRAAHKTSTYSAEWRNRKFHEFMRNGINNFLETNFSEQDMDIIYTKLGNAINHELSVKFVNSGYDLNILNNA
jgi:hypothetical protein